MAIYYAPFPSTQPQTSLTQWTNGDWWVNPTTRSDGVTGTATAYKFLTSPTKRWAAQSTGALPPTNACPAITSVTKSDNVTATIGQALNLYAVQAYGGSAILTAYTTNGTFVGYTVSVSPALPAGLSLTKTYSVISITDSNGKQNLYNAADVYITGTPTTAVGAQSYTLTFTDALGQTSTAAFTFGTSASGSSELTTTVAVASKTVDVDTAVSFIPVLASGGTTPYTFTINPALTSTGLSINSANGQITGTATALISNQVYEVTVTDSSTPAKTSSKSFSLTVNGIALTTSLTIPTKSLVQNIAFTSFRPVTAGGGSGYLTYSVSPSLPAGLTYNSANGFITGTATQVIEPTNFTVSVVDQSNPPQSGTPRVFSLTVTALPSLTTNLNVPVANAIVNVTKSFTPVVASGGYGTVTYTISPSLPTGFSLNSSTGAISGTSTTFSANTNYTVTATDSATTPQTSSKTFSFEVVAQALVNTVLRPNLKTYANVTLTSFYGSEIQPISASGGYGTLTYSVSPSLPSGMTLYASTGVIYGAPASSNANTVYTITVTDQTTPTPQSTSNNFTLVVDSLPALTIDVSSANTDLIAAKSNLTPLLLDQNQSYTWQNPYSVTNNGYGSVTRDTANTTLGESGSTGYQFTRYSAALGNWITQQIPYALYLRYSTYFSNPSPIIFTIQDGAGQKANVTIYVATKPKSLTKSAGTPGITVTTGVPLNYSPLVLSSYETSVTYANTGALPSGLVYNSANGAVTGTPTQTGNVSFVLTATDFANQTVSQNTYIDVISPPTLFANTNVNSVNAVINQTTSSNPVVASGGYGTITFAINPSLPSGLNYRTSNGQIWGASSTLSANQQYTVVVSDGANQSVSNTFYLSVINPPVIATKTASNTVTLTQYVAATKFQPISGSAGVGTLTYTSSDLPSGLSIYSSNGFVYGTPTATQSATTSTITVTDSLGSVATNVATITIVPPSALTVSNTSYNVTYGVATSRIPVQASGGQGANTYALISGTLPTGLTFNTANGYITGTPTQLKANSSYTVEVTDSISQTARGTFLLGSIAPVIVVNLVTPYKSITEYSAMQSYSPITATGGYGNLFYSISSGTLPQGLIFNPTNGQISGTPTQIVSSTPTIRVTDESGQYVDTQFDLNVVAGATPVLQTTLAQSAYVLNQLQPYSIIPVTASSGIPPYTYSLEGTLPNGLSFIASTGEITGTPTEIANANTYVISVTDAVPQISAETFTISVIGVAASVDTVGRTLAQLAYDRANVLSVSLIAANNDLSNVVSNVTAIRFDTDSGFDVTDLGNNEVKIAMNSTFKTWKVNGQSDLVASGLDTVEFKSANGISITTGPLDNPKSITFDGGTLYDQINTKFDSSGGTISGDVSISGNLTVTGKTVYAQTENTLIKDNILTLNAAIDQTSSPIANSGIEIDRGSENNVYLIYDESQNYWTFTNDGIQFEKIASDADIITLNTKTNEISNVANASYAQANASNVLAQSSYDKANLSGNVAQAGFDKANSANVLAQAAFDAANSVIISGGGKSFGIISANNGNVVATQANDTVTLYGDGGIQVGVDSINKRVVFSVPAGYVFNSADYGYVYEPLTTNYDYGEIL